MTNEMKQERTENATGTSITAPLDAFDGVVLHPSLDFKDGVLLLGFSYRDKALKNTRVFFIAHGGSVSLLTDTSITVNGKLFSIDERRGVPLASLEERWGITEAQAFIDKRAEGNTPIGYAGRSTLVEQIAAEVRQHIQFEDELDSYILAAWVIGTYFHRIFYAFPFLHIKAPKGSGKSQCLNFLRQLSFNAEKSRPSVAALGDTIDAAHGTYLIDQADSLGRENSQELLDILADSYKRSGGKRRVISIDKGRRQMLELETYGPKAFASIKELPEDLRDRCFLLTLTRSKRNDLLDPDDPYLDWAQKRGELYKALLTEYAMVDAEYAIRRRQHRDNKTITGRRLELWLPIEVILCYFGAEVRLDAVRRRFLEQYGLTEYEPNELEAEMFRVLLSRLESEPETTLSPKEISEDMDKDVFRSPETKQQASAVGWAIKKFNLASEEKGRTSGGKRYLFKKERVQSVYDSYSKSAVDHTPPTPLEMEAQYLAGSGAGSEV
jgi:hypothetical protein